jgi:O-antigen/teichoic acid export membrane protein
VAQRHQKHEPHRSLLWLSLGLVTVVSGGILAITLFVPEMVVSALFGPAYLSIAPLLWLYAIATMLYALANVYISYWLSIGDGRGSLFAIAAGMTQVVALWIFHASLVEVVLVQIYIMSVLLVVLVVRDLWHNRPRRPVQTAEYVAIQ